MEAALCSLPDLIKFKTAKNIPWFEEELVLLLHDMSHALYNLEELRIAHRDIRPEHIIVTRGGFYKLADFGASLILDATTNVIKAPASGIIGYLAPEIIKSEGKCEYNPFLADIYSLGKTLKRLVTTSKSCPEMSEKVVIYVQSIIEQMLSKEPEERLTSYSIMGRCIMTLNNLEDELRVILNTLTHAARFMRFKLEAETNGNPFSQHTIGRMYEEGFSVKQDHEKAIQWYAKAAKQNNPASQHRLALMYMHRGSAAKNLARSIMLCKNFTKLGYALDGMDLKKQKLFFDVLEKYVEPCDEFKELRDLQFGLKFYGVEILAKIFATFVDDFGFNRKRNW